MTQPPDEGYPGVDTCERVLHQVPITNIRFYKAITGMIFDRKERFEISSIGQFIQINYGEVLVSENVLHEVAANEARATSN